MSLEFHANVFLTCRNVQAEGPRVAGTVAKLPYTLEGVSYSYQIDRNQEPPFAIGEFWLYLRLFRTSDAIGKSELALSLYYLGDNNEMTSVLINGNKKLMLGEIAFHSNFSVYSMPYRISNLEVQKLGPYKVTIFKKIDHDWKGRIWKKLADQYFVLEAGK